MKVAGFSFIKNAQKFDYPIVEAISSILPVCDKIYVAVGDSDDDTKCIVQEIHLEKIIIIDTVWDTRLKEGKVLSVETNKAFEAISLEYDWCFYIQGDEVVHEKYLDEIVNAMEIYKNDKKIDGLLFDYLHFYGSYDYIGTTSEWYDKEIRIIKNNKSIYSYKDAQGFRKKPKKKLNVRQINAKIHHYGWVKEPEKMHKKVTNLHTFYHFDNFKTKGKKFQYEDYVSTLKKFKGTHPKVINDRIKQKNWKFDFNISFNKRPFKDRLKKFLKNKLGINTYYTNYKNV